jgi:hypothetical protein
VVRGAATFVGCFGETAHIANGAIYGPPAYFAHRVPTGPALFTTCRNGTLLALGLMGSGGCLVKIQRASAIAVDPMPEHETAESALTPFNSPQDDLMERLDRAQKTIRTLEQRVAMQQAAYIIAMREKNRRIRELQCRLQGRQ